MKRTLRLRTAIGAHVARLAPSLPVVVPAVTLALALLLTAAEAAARPGGGSSFGGGRSGGGSSGGSSSGGGGSGGSGGDCFWAVELVVFLVQLTIEHPAIGVPLDIVVIGVVIWIFRSREKKKLDWSTTFAAERAAARSGGLPASPGMPPQQPTRSPRKALHEGLARIDPNFSLILFEDFAYSLFATVHEARGAGRAEVLAPYLQPTVMEQIAASSRALQRVHSVVVGALRYHDVQLSTGGGRAQVTLEIEANYTEVSRSGAEQAYYVVERWTLSRPREARARTPETARTIGCPHCGAPLDGMRGNTCRYCNTEVHAGEFDWMVEGIQVIDRNERGPMLTGDTPEMGTSLPTVVDRDAQKIYQQLTARDPGFQWQRFSERVSVIFQEMQVSWSTLEWSRARPFVSDQLFQMLSYWIETYRRNHMRNVTENARITGIEIAAVLTDRYFDAITVRVRASSLDYTITDAGEVVGGSRSRERAYTEYWTLIRGVGAQTKAASDRACPNCGAPLNINQAGHCNVCKVKVTAGQFDWVLSRIEQDEAYT